MIASAKFAGLKRMEEQGKLLIVSATVKEVSETMAWIKENNFPAVVCITGPGISAAVFELTKSLINKDCRLVINTGIAGSFREDISIGETVEVTEECFADMGAEDDEKFIHISEMGFELTNDAFRNFYFPVSVNPITESGLRKVKAITVNKVHGHELSIQKIKEKFNPDIESMEGAAVAYVCRQLNIPCLQVRSISNRVEKRDKSKWEIEKAIDSLNQELKKLLGRLQPS